MIMSLDNEIKQILNDFDNVSSEKILEILNQIKPLFKSDLIPEYLQGKIKKISDIENETERKKQCKALIPYFDWYVQGL